MCSVLPVGILAGCVTLASQVTSLSFLEPGGFELDDFQNPSRLLCSVIFVTSEKVKQSVPKRKVW